MLYVLLIIAGLLSWFTMKTRTILLAICAFGAWFVTLAYIVAYPPGNLTAGDNIHSMLIYVLAGTGIAILILGIRASRQKSYNVEMEYDDAGKPRIIGKVTGEAVSMSRSSRHGWGGSYAESPEEYQARLSNLRKRKRS